MNKIIDLLKRIVLSYIILYGYNLIASQFNMVIPINAVTVTLVAFFGFPCLIALLLLKIILL